MQLAWKFGVIALVALALTALPGGGGALDAAFTLLTIAFFTAIAYLAYRLYRQFGSELDTLEDRQRLILYGSVGLAFLALCGTGRLINDLGGFGLMIWLSLLALASYGVYWVWHQYRAIR